MKEASGEANLTVVTIILIGVIVAIATPIVNSMMTNTKAKAECMDQGMCWNGNECGECDGDTGHSGYSNTNP